MTTFLTAIVPDPECLGGQFRKEIHGDNPKQLAEVLREWITVDTNYGASDIGSIFNVYRDGCVVGYLRYNGRFNWADPLLNPANHIEIE